MNNISPETQAKIQLWKPRDPDTWPDWYRWDGGWYECDCENTRYTVWDDLPAGALVWDVGSYEGEWIRRMNDKYPFCHYCGFEPARRAYGMALERHKENENVTFHNAGLGVTSGTFKLYDDQRDSATFIENGKYGEDVDSIDAQVVSVREFMESENVECVHLMALNIEGGEFELLPYLTGSNLIRRFERIMIQWHSVVDNAWPIQVQIQSALAKTHRMTWNHGAWEAWRSRSLPWDSVAERSTVCTPVTS